MDGSVLRWRHLGATDAVLSFFFFFVTMDWWMSVMDVVAVVVDLSAQDGK